MRRLCLWLLCAAAVSATATAQSASIENATSLALFDEVWNTINDSFYDPAFGGLDWPGVRAELRPKAAAAESVDAARVVVNAMLARLKRSHFALLPGSASADDDLTLHGEATVEIDVRMLNGDAIVVNDRRQRPSGTVGFSGQRIASIDGRSMAAKPGEVPLTSWRRVNAALHGMAGSSADIVFADGARAAVPRRVPGGVAVQFSNLPPMRVTVDHRAVKTSAGRQAGVIAFNIWMAQVDEPFARAVDEFRQSDGLVIDLRGNPGGLAAMISGLAGHLVETPDLLGTMRMRQVPQLKFAANPRTSTPDGRAVKPFAGPVAILVDEMSASASECFAGGLQDLGRVRVFGRTSMGQALPASTKRLSNGDVLEYAIGDFVTSTGRSLEGRGVVPDEIQPLSIASLAAGHDDPLDAALAWIDRQPKAIR